MMPIVLLDPPVPTPTDQQIPHQKASDGALPAGAENLLMTNVVTE